MSPPAKSPRIPFPVHLHFLCLLYPLYVPALLRLLPSPLQLFLPSSLLFVSVKVDSPVSDHIQEFLHPPSPIHFPLPYQRSFPQPPSEFRIPALFLQCRHDPRFHPDPDRRKPDLRFWAVLSGFPHTFRHFSAPKSMLHSRSLPASVPPGFLHTGCKMPQTWRTSLHTHFHTTHRSVYIPSALFRHLQT